MPVSAIFTQIFAIVVTAIIGLMTSAHQATALTAHEVLTNMESDERFTYVSGVVDGLAMARWVADKPNADGMNCIYDCYYGAGDKARNVVAAWLERNPDQQVGTLMYLLIKRECGE